MTGINHTGRSTDDPTDDLDADSTTELTALVRGLQSRIDRLESTVDQQAEAIARLEEENADLRQRLDQHRGRIDAIDDRTDLLRVVETADQLDGQQRSLVLLQHAQREAGDTASGRVDIDKDAAETALHHPDIDRTTYYSDMARCARWVGDETICWYDDGELHLDLSGDTGEVAQAIATHGGREAGDAVPASTGTATEVGDR